MLWFVNHHGPRATAPAAEPGSGPRPLPGSGPCSLPLGYARPALPGPTTNFVGDAMVGGAADLVRARLEAANEAAAAAAGAGLPPLAGPVRLLATGGGEGGGAVPPPPKPTALTPAPCSPSELRKQALALAGRLEGREEVGRLEG